MDLWINTRYWPIKHAQLETWKRPISFRLYVLLEFNVGQHANGITERRLSSRKKTGFAAKNSLQDATCSRSVKRHPRWNFFTTTSQVANFKRPHHVTMHPIFLKLQSCKKTIQFVAGAYRIKRSYPLMLHASGPDNEQGTDKWRLHPAWKKYLFCTLHRMKSTFPLTVRCHLVYRRCCWPTCS
jgi:hypothetical protein